MPIEFLYFGLAGVAGVVVIFVAIRSVRVARTWRAGLQLIAQTHHLKLVQPQGAISAIYDLVMGDIGRYSVSIHIDSDSSYGSDSETRYMLMELTGGSRGNLQLGRPGAFDQPGVTDYSNTGNNARVEIGDAAFDAAVELRSPPKPLIEALRNDASMRQGIMQFVTNGLIVDGCETKLRTRSFPETAAAYLEQFNALLAFARNLDEIAED